MNILEHARARMRRYNISQELVEAALHAPDSEVAGHGARRIAQKRLNGYLLRVIYENQGSEKIVITVYKAKSSRYEI